MPCLCEFISKKEKDKKGKTSGLNPVPKASHFLVCCTEISVKYMYYYNHSECISQKEKDKKSKTSGLNPVPKTGQIHNTCYEFITPVMIFGEVHP